MAISEHLLPIVIKEKKKPSENANERAGQKGKKKKKTQKSKPIQSSKAVSWEQCFAVLTYLRINKIPTYLVSCYNRNKTNFLAKFCQGP